MDRSPADVLTLREFLRLVQLPSQPVYVETGGRKCVSCDARLVGGTGRDSSSRVGWTGLFIVPGFIQNLPKLSKGGGHPVFILIATRGQCSPANREAASLAPSTGNIFSIGEKGIFHFA